MGVSIKSIVLLVAYALLSNIIFLMLARSGIGIDCSNLEVASYNETYEETAGNYTEFGTSHTSIINLALGRCDGLDWWLYLIFELPVVVGLLYIARAFIGAT